MRTNYYTAVREQGYYKQLMDALKQQDGGPCKFFHQQHDYNAQESDTIHFIVCLHTR